MEYNIVTYFLLFMVYSVAGWIMEVTCKSFEAKKFINRGFMIGPYCPIYGWGAIFITILLKRYISDWIVLFFMSMITCGILEYLTSYVMEKLFHARWWDYSRRKYNINGRICLETLVPFGLLGLTIMYITNPIILNALQSIPDNILNVIAIVLFVMFTIDGIVSLKVVSNVRATSTKLNKEAKTMDNTEETLDFEQKHKEDLQRLRGFRLLDDDFMSKVFEDKACAEFLLQVILQRHDLKVQSAQGQYDIKNLQGRSIRLDILAVDSNNRIYNIEIQRSDLGADAKRARYNSSLIDANITEAGDKYDALTETYVIFITENDVLKAGLPIYHIDRIIQETGEPFGDEAHIIYVNSQIKDETELGKLMHDFSCTNPKDMYYKILADRVRYFKEDEEGVLTMCREMENMRKAERIEIAKRMLVSGKLTYEDIAAFTDLTLEEIKALAVQKTA